MGSGDMSLIFILSQSTMQVVKAEVKGEVDEVKSENDWPRPVFSNMFGLQLQQQQVTEFTSYSIISTFLAYTYVGFTLTTMSTSKHIAHLIANGYRSI